MTHNPFDRMDEIPRDAAAAEYFARLRGSAPAARMELLLRLRGHPVLRAYLNAREFGGAEFRNTVGWHAYGELLTTLVVLGSAGEVGGMPLPVLPPNLKAEGEHPEETWREYVFWKLVTARPYLWRARVFEALRGAPPHPPCEFTRELLPLPCMFWSFETAYEHSQPDGTSYDSNWALVSQTSQGIEVLVELENPVENTWTLDGGCIPYGLRYPDDVPEDQRAKVNEILTMLAFLASPYIEQTEERIPRHLRRQTPGETSSPSPDPLVHVVALRKVAEDAVAAYHAAHRDWRHRWWVAGHFRQQPFGLGRQQARTIWIAPYLKGPADKPMLEKVYDVRR